ncbi:hypothetical protein AAZX31_06G209900 [Glycine max]
MSTKKYDKNNKVNMDLMINESYIMIIYTCMFHIRLKHLAQQMQNIENENKKRLDAIDKTKTSMLKAICTLAKQDYKDSTKDGDEDVAMSGTHDNTFVYRQPLHCQNANKRVSNPTMKCTTNQAYEKSDATLNNIETIFIPGDDDDDEFLRPSNRGMKAKFVHDENTTTYSSPKTIKLSGPVRTKENVDESLKEKKRKKRLQVPHRSG